MKSMSKFWKTITGLLLDNVESVAVKNNGGSPQIVIIPKNAAREILDTVRKAVNNGKEATQEDQQTNQQATCATNKEDNCR